MIIGRWTPVIVWGCMILGATSLPGRTLPAGPAGSDKAVHFLVYAVLGLLAIRAAMPGSTAPLRTIALTVVAVAAFAALDEWHQGFIPGRFPDAADWVADVAGATAGIGFTALFTLRRSARS